VLVAAVAIADLTFLDQRIAALHLFPIVLLAGLVWTCARAIGGRAIGAGIIDAGRPSPAPGAG
jgi:hypothetical protein